MIHRYKCKILSGKESHQIFQEVFLKIIHMLFQNVLFSFLVFKLCFDSVRGLIYNFKYSYKILTLIKIHI
jgi:hypothetical protein